MITWYSLGGFICEWVSWDPLEVSFAGEVVWSPLRGFWEGLFWRISWTHRVSFWRGSLLGVVLQILRGILFEGFHCRVFLQNPGRLYFGPWLFFWAGYFGVWKTSREVSIWKGWSQNLRGFVLGSYENPRGVSLGGSFPGERLIKSSWGFHFGIAYFGALLKPIWRFHFRGHKAYLGISFKGRCFEGLFEHPGSWNPPKMRSLWGLFWDTRLWGVFQDTDILLYPVLSQCLSVGCIKECFDTVITTKLLYYIFQTELKFHDKINYHCLM